MATASRMRAYQCDDDSAWYSMRTGTGTGTGIGTPAHPRLAPLPAPRFVRPTILTANYDFDDDGFQAALHVAPDGGFPAPYVPPVSARERRRRSAEAAAASARRAAREDSDDDDDDDIVAMPAPRKASNADNPILISSDEEVEEDEDDGAPEFSIVKVTRLARPGIGASRTGQQRNAYGQGQGSNGQPNKKRLGHAAKKLMRRRARAEAERAAAAAGEGKGKAKADDDVVIISDDDEDSQDDDEDVGTLNMAQTYAALLECIGGSTVRSNPTALPGQSISAATSTSTSRRAAKLEVKGEAAATGDAQDSATDSLAIMSLERRRAGIAALPARLPTAAHTAGRDRDRTAAAPSERIAPPQAKRIKAEPSERARKSLPASNPARPSQSASAVSSSLLVYSVHAAAASNTTTGASQPHPPSANFVPPNKSRWKGFTPCPQCDMLLPTKMTNAELIAHRASMPHRLALALPGRPEEILAASARRVQQLRNDADLKRARVRALIATLGRSEGAVGFGAGDEEGEQGGATGAERRQGQLLTLTRQTNRGFCLLEKYGWEAGIGIGRKEWRRNRRVKRLAKEERKHKKEQERKEQEEGMDQDGPRGDDAREVAERGASVLAGEQGEASASAQKSSSRSKKDRHESKKRKSKAIKERKARLGKSGNTADSAIALSDSEGEDAHADISGQSSHGFLDFHFDSSDESTSSRSTVQMDEDDIMRSASDDEEDDDEDEEGDDIEWVGVETKRKKGESVHAWLLRKFDTTERAKRVDAGKKRKRGDGGDGNESEDWQDDDDDDDDDDGADADGEADMHGNGHQHALGSSNGFVPAHSKMSRLEPLAVSIKMQHALDRSGVGASSAYRTPLNRLARLGGTVDVLRSRPPRVVRPVRHHARYAAHIQRRPL